MRTRRIVYYKWIYNAIFDIAHTIWVFDIPNVVDTQKCINMKKQQEAATKSYDYVT